MNVTSRYRMIACYIRLRYGVLLHGRKAGDQVDLPAAYRDYLDLLRRLDAR